MAGQITWSEEEENSGVAIKEEMQKIVIEFPGYGYRRVKVELRNRNHIVNQKKVRRLMKEDNLICKKEIQIADQGFKSWRKIYPNLVKTLEVTGMNQLWVADITYIQLYMARHENQPQRTQSSQRGVFFLCVPLCTGMKKRSTSTTINNKTTQ